MDNPNQFRNTSNTPVTMGEIMRAQRRDAIRAAAMFMAVVLYGAVLIYTGVHNFNLISHTVAPDQQLFAITALLCLEGASIFLPIAIHFWFAPGPQRMVGYLLYAVNFTIVIVNTILDAINNRADSIPEWLSLYATFILPATPIVIGVGIAFIFLLDPSKKIHDARAAAEAASMDAMALHMREAANRDDVNEAIHLAAVKDMQEATSRITGRRPLELPAPASAKRPRTAAAAPSRKPRPTEVVVLNAERSGPPRLVKSKARRVRKAKGG
ncbi:MAG: hypothetical protein M1546_17780 [Chloroflexi bacterium]|nr:hypothetical protein [Chloroflexota bacterium]